jgi:hypothetical protein
MQPKIKSLQNVKTAISGSLSSNILYSMVLCMIQTGEWGVSFSLDPLKTLITPPGRKRNPALHVLDLAT